MNTGAPWPTPKEAETRVLAMQRKLHRWAAGDPGRRFDDLYNLVCDAAFLVVAWNRVRGNKGARTAGVDGQTARSIEAGQGVGAFLDDLRADLKARTFTPLPVRERTIPKRGGTKRRSLGIPSVRDRVVQAALKLVLEPIFEADFKPSSYGFRPRRRAQDAIADEIDHSALMDRVGRRTGDRRVQRLVKAFLRSGVLSEDGLSRDTITGTPAGRHPLTVAGQHRAVRAGRALRP